jgi:hypothetical protein
MRSSLLTEGTTATSRTPPWLASGWECPGRRPFQRVRKSGALRISAVIWIAGHTGAKKSLGTLNESGLIPACVPFLRTNLIPPWRLL